MPETPNPYIAGSPITGPEMFFGREDVFTFVRQALTGQHRDHVLVLYGQRRTGNTSVLYQMSRRLGERYVCIFIDLHGLALNGLGGFLWELANHSWRLNRGLACDPGRRCGESFGPGRAGGVCVGGDRRRAGALERRWDLSPVSWQRAGPGLFQYHRGAPVRSVAELPDGSLWAAGDRLVVRSEDGGSTWTRVGTSEGLGSDIGTLVQDEAGQVWAGAYNGGVSVWDGQNWRALQQ